MKINRDNYVAKIISDSIIKIWPELSISILIFRKTLPQRIKKALLLTKEGVKITIEARWVESRTQRFPPDDSSGDSKGTLGRLAATSRKQGGARSRA